MANVFITKMDGVPDRPLIKLLRPITVAVVVNRNFARDWWDSKVKSFVGGNSTANADYIEDWIEGRDGCLLEKLQVKAVGFGANAVLRLDITATPYMEKGMQLIMATGEAAIIADACASSDSPASTAEAVS